MSTVTADLAERFAVLEQRSQNSKTNDNEKLMSWVCRSCLLFSQFYKRSVRKEYEQHWDEEVNSLRKKLKTKCLSFQDPERVDQIMERAVMDADWVVKKYAKKKWKWIGSRTRKILVNICEMAGTRREVLRLYKSILRLGQKWEATDPIETRVEREYIADEAR